MQLYWGSYSFLVNGVNVATELETMFSDSRIPYAQKIKARVKGRIQGSGQADLTSKQLAMEYAMRFQYQDLILYRDDGGESATVLRNASSITGVTVTAGPSFTDESGSEYATQRKFDVSFEAEYPLASGILLLSFKERLEFSGGLPVYIMKRGLDVLPQRQMVWRYTEFCVKQTGEAVGYTSKPPYPPPIWPGALKQAPILGEMSKERHGQSYQKYGITWSYEFESATPLIGSPTSWL